jgi:glycosyltransferase involved in cell wall biosynthesis
MSEQLGVSIIIVNYNNDRFLTAAIDSAFSQDYSRCEVIVVDDCSTDNSRGVIARYGDRIRTVLRDTNGHQIAALNSAWPLALHPILIFLDSDDLLLRHAAATVAGVWTAGAVKVQFPLLSVDQTGSPLGHVAPKYPPALDTTTIRAELLRTGQSHSSPGSGNAYAKWLLEQVRDDGGFDIDNLREYWMDNILECNAPFYGEVLTVHEPLVCYRRHESNLFLPNSIDHARFATMARTFTLKLDYLAERCHSWGVRFDPAAARARSLYLVQCQLAAAKLAPAGDPPQEPVPGALWRALRACLATPLPSLHRLILAAWFTGVAIAPRGLARRLIALRFVAARRPAWFERLFLKPKIRRDQPREQPISP